MNLVKVKCAFCGKEYFRQAGRVNEAKKFGWNQYCSKECLAKDRTKKRVLICENCAKTFERAPNDVSPHNYCSQSCAAIVNNKRYPKREVKLKICPVCQKQFKGVSKYCSKECKLRALRRYTPQELIQIIKKTAQKLKRVPARREMEGINKTCKRFFGSWNNTILAAGLQPNRSHSQRMYKRTNTVAADGHLCDSISELLIDNWFIKNKIEHTRNVFYPDTNYKADWGIDLKGKTIFVEYFGLAKDSPRYDRSIAKKKALCCKHKIKLIEIYPWDLYPKINLGTKLKIFLS